MQLKTTRFLVTSLVGAALMAGSAVSQKADLTISSLTFPSEWKAGRSETYKFQVGNIGTVIAIPTSVGVFQSTNSIISSGDTLLKSHAVPALFANTSFAVQGNLTLDTATKSANVYIGALADRMGQIAESNELNNYKSKKLSLVALPNLVVTQVGVQPLLQPNMPYSITCTVKNTGGAASTAVQVGVVSSSNSTLSPADDFIRSRLLTALQPGSSRFLSFTGRPWPTAMTGARYVGVVADIGRVLQEGSEANGNGLLRNIQAFQGSGAFLTYEAPRYGKANGASTPHIANFSNLGGTANIAITAPALPFHSYVLVWSISSQQLQIDVMTELGLGLLGTPIMPGWIGKADALGNAKATFNMPVGINTNFSVNTHSVWFDPSFQMFVGFGANTLRTIGS